MIVEDEDDEDNYTDMHGYCNSIWWIFIQRSTNLLAS